MSITLLACEMSAIVPWFEHSLALPFFGIEMKTDFFQSRGHCWFSLVMLNLTVFCMVLRSNGHNYMGEPGEVSDSHKGPKKE